MEKLNLKQRQALSRFAESGKPAFPYEAGARIATCMALERRGLLKFYFSPEEILAAAGTWYRFEITEAGRKAVEAGTP